MAFDWVVGILHSACSGCQGIYNNIGNMCGIQQEKDIIGFVYDDKRPDGIWQALERSEGFPLYLCRHCSSAG